MLSKIAGAIESAIVHSVKLQNKYPPLFIVGAPRSGTTVVSQHVINTLALAYFPNLAKQHPKACITYGWWSHRKYRFEGSYESTYGIIDGPASPSDGWGIFHRWFPRYELDRPVAVERLHELRTIVRAFEQIYGAPFINKNNANSTRIDLINQLFPDARFIHISRDIYKTVASMLVSRKAHDVPEGEWWGVAPPQFHNRSFTSELERVVYQTWGVERYITDCLQSVPVDHHIALRYEDFCFQPNMLIEWVRETYVDAGVTIRDRGLPKVPSFQVSVRKHTNKKCTTEIDRIVSKLEAGGE